MNFKQSFNDQPTIAPFSTLVEKIFRFFPFIYQIDSRKPAYNKPNTVKTLRCPLKIPEALFFKSENHESLFAEMPKPHFLSKLKRQFSFFLEVSSKYSENSCSELIENITMHMATLPTGIIGYIAFPITTVKPCRYSLIVLKKRLFR